jgi:hypothetical protein
VSGGGDLLTLTVGVQAGDVTVAVEHAEGARVDLRLDEVQLERLLRQLRAAQRLARCWGYGRVAGHG